MTTYIQDVATKQYQQNLVIKIGSDHFASYQPDSGLTIDADKIGLVREVNLNPTQIDIRDINMTISSAAFTLIDASGNVTAWLAEDDNNQLGKTVSIYVGRITTGSPFADYQLISTTTIRSVTKIANGYYFEASEITNKLRQSIFSTQSVLTAAYVPAASIIGLADATGFPASGTIKIDNQFLTYASIAANALSGVAEITAGQLDSDDTSHLVGSIAHNVVNISGNPIDLILQLLLSGSSAVGAGAAYDVLVDGLAIDESLINIAQFESVRDDFFSGQTYDLYLYNMTDSLAFIERELLLPTGTRMFPADGQIDFAILDKAPSVINVTGLDEDKIVGTPEYTVRSDIVVNQIRAFWDYHEGEGEFRETTLFTDTDSIASFGETPEIQYYFKGVLEANNGTTLVTNLMNRLLVRLASPRTQITATCQMDVSLEVPGDIVRLEHVNLPEAGGGVLGLNSLVEVMSKAINFDTGTVVYGLEFTSFSALRTGLIAPAPLIAGVTSQSIFDVPDGSCFLAGMFLKLWNDATSAYYPDAALEISSISNNTITMASTFTTTLTTAVRVKIADYDEAEIEAQAAYAFISPNTGVFVSDSKTAYKILF